MVFDFLLDAAARTIVVALRRPHVGPFPAARSAPVEVAKEHGPPPSNDAGEHESRDDGVATAGLAVAFLLVGLHLRRVVAALRHTDGRTHAIEHTNRKQVVETRKPFGLCRAS